jgi:hypothetical protein
MYATRHYNSNGEEKRHGTKYLESRKEKTSPIHAQHEEEEEERKTPRSQKKKDPSKGNGDSPIAVQLEQCMLSCY